MTEREILMRKIAANDFAMLDLHLYLDTHPNNNQIAEKLNEYRTKSAILKKEYEENYGPIMQSNENGNRWAWISNPWPWDSSIEEVC
ncbi:MAG TPA: spore coat protein CotJB [Clostridiales bacterium]|nr:spore coat protein CotJB [Clostridiales bacterium]